MSSNMLMSCRLIMEGLLNGPPGAQVQSLCLKRCLTFLVAINQVIKKNTTKDYKGDAKLPQADGKETAGLSPL